MQIKCNIFKTLFRNAGIVALSFICERIRSGYYANAIKVLRQALAQGDNLLADRLKKALDAFTVSALYNGARKLEHMVKYIGLIVLDFDNLDPAAIPDLKRRAAEMKETIVAFVSPSGKGLKIICRPYVSWALTLANHVRTFLAMAALYLETLGIAADGSGKDPGRLCFVSHDADIFFDPSRLEGFEGGSMGVEEGIGVQGTGYGEKEEPPAPQTAEAVQPQTPEEVDDPRLTLLFLEAAKAVDQSGTHYKDGSRNAFLYQLAHRCKESGIEKTDMLRLFGKFYSGLEPGEVLSSVDSAYNKQPEAKPRTPKKGRRGTDDFAMLEWLPANYNGYYDEINEHVYIRKKGETLFHPYNHRRDGSIILIELRKAGIACQSKEDVRDILFSSLSQTKNIPKEWFLNHPWDGKGDPFEAFCKRFHVKDPEYFRKTLKMWSIALVASLFEDDVVNHNIFVLQSDKQGIGKTRLWSHFLPKPLRMYYSEGVPDMRNKDAKVLMSRTLLINLDELGVLSSRSEVNNLKALLTMLGPIERGAYQEEFKKYIHRASFCAAVNDAKIITDPCGSRRHYIHHLDGIDDYNLPVPDEYWGQVFSWYTGDERYYLLPGEVQAVIDRNEAHRQMSLEEGFIRDYAIKPQPGEDAPWLSISQIVKKLTMLTGMNLDKSSHRVVGCVLTKEGYPSRIVHGYTQYQLYFKTNEQLGNESQS